MIDFKFDVTDVTVDESKIIDLSVNANMEYEESSKRQYSIVSNFNAAPIRTEDGKVFLDLKIDFDCKDAPSYNVSIKTRTGFTFPDGADVDSQDDYLRTIGLSRAFDYARSYIKLITSFGIWESMDLPGIPVQKK